LQQPERTGLLSRFQGAVDAFLDGTPHHYSCFLPEKLGRPSEAMLRAFYSGITIGKDQSELIEQIPKDAAIIYVTKHKSNFEYLYYHTYYSNNGLRTPEIGIEYNIILWQPLKRLLKITLAHLVHFFQHLSLQNPFRSGYIRRELQNGRAGFLSLVEKGGFHGRFVKSKIDPIRHLIEIQKSIDRTIYLVPLLMFFSKDPIRSQPTLKDIFFGPESKPGKIRRLVALFKKPGKIFVEVSEPVNLRQYIDSGAMQEKSTEVQSLQLRRNLLLQFNRHRQGTIGPTLKTLEELKENILTNDRFRKFMEKHAENRQVPIQEIRKEADSYLQEIAAQYSPGLVKTASVAVNYIIKTMFDGVVLDKEGLKYVKSASKKAPLILIPCHKSHIDYLILSYILYHNHLPCPHIAAGKNLAFWPLGPIFRRGGAFFIRRSFRGAVLYAKVFTEYLHKLLEEGFNIEFFIEGTRSRTGKLVLPKLGFLSMLLDAYKNGACEEMAFVPIYIGYDRVLEESAYVHELEGGKKEPESLFQILRARKFLKKRFGKIYIQFHAPLSLSRMLDDQGMRIDEMTQKEKNTFCRDLGFRVITAINRSAVVSAYGLCAAAILNSTSNRLTFSSVKNIAESYLKYLHAQGAKLADTLLINQDYAIDSTLETFVQRKFLEPFPGQKKSPKAESKYRVNVNARTSLEYYKNNCISFFIPAAFTAAEIINRDAFQFSASDLHQGYRFLRRLFKFEFTYDTEISTETFVRKSIKNFIDDAVLMPHQTLPDTYNLTSAGFRKLKHFSGFLINYLESYKVVLYYYKRLSSNGKNNKERLKKIESVGRRLYKRNEIERKEALSPVVYQNAIDFCSSRGIRGAEDADHINYYAETIDRYLSKLQ
jgi:glycerol-3-phosphate O-acyltransferase